MGGEAGERLVWSGNGSLVGGRGRRTGDGVTVGGRGWAFAVRVSGRSQKGRRVGEGVVTEEAAVLVFA